MKLDAIDLKILHELQRDGRLSNVALADRVGLSPSPCLTRVRALEKAGVIDRYVALLNPEKVSANVSVFIQITLERQSKKVLETFERKMMLIPEVMECYLMSGDSDYLLRVVVPDTIALKDFILEKLTEIPGISTIRSGFALKLVKFKTAMPVKETFAEAIVLSSKVRKK